MASKKSINAFSLFLSDKKNQNPSMSKAELSSMYQEEYEVCLPKENMRLFCIYVIDVKIFMNYFFSK